MHITSIWNSETYEEGKTFDFSMMCTALISFHGQASTTTHEYEFLVLTYQERTFASLSIFFVKNSVVPSILIQHRQSWYSQPFIFCSCFCSLLDSLQTNMPFEGRRVPSWWSCRKGKVQFVRGKIEVRKMFLASFKSDQSGTSQSHKSAIPCVWKVARNKAGPTNTALKLPEHILKQILCPETNWMMNQGE